MTSPPFAPPHDRVSWSLIEARGEDARPFLQGQLSCDVMNLVPGESTNGLLLTPSGDVITSLRCDGLSDGLDLVVRSELAESARSALARFLLRTACSLTIADTSSGDYDTVADQVTRGEPGPAEFAPGLSAHTFGPGFVARRVSFSKGCFTGQELVGRLDARGGNVPFRLARVTGEDMGHVDAVVRSVGPSGERARQRVTTVVAGSVVSGLALVHRSLVSDGSIATIDGVLVELLHP
jgi:folate-binding Fe-S cluster repair protein YgfZ